MISIISTPSFARLSEWKLLAVPMFRHIQPEKQTLPFAEGCIKFFDHIIGSRPPVLMQLEELLSTPAIDGKVIISTQQLQNISGGIRADPFDGADLLE